MRSNTGRFCRDSARPAGRSLCSRIVRQATAVSLASAGRTKSRPGDGPQRGEVLDRLVGRAVLAQPDRVVRPDVGDRQLHERGQPDRAAHVVGEGEERAAVDAGAAVQRDAVHDRAHGVLADAEVQGAAVGPAAPHLGLPVGRQERRFALDRGVVALGQVGRAAPQLGQHRVERGEHLAGGLAGGDALRVGVPGGQLRPPSPRAACGCDIRSSSAAPSGLPCCPGVEPLLPGGVRLLAAVDDLAGVLDDLGGDVEGLRPGRSRGSPWWPRPRRRPAPSRARRRCSACSARASR